jgi:DNA-binding CsgD family transcriptional regulator
VVDADLPKFALLGRDAELGRVGLLLRGSGGATAVLRAGAGAGKTALLNEIARSAGHLNTLVLSVTGYEAEHGFAYAALHQLLLPVLDRISALPEPARGRLQAAFGMSEPLAESGVMVIGAAVGALLAGLAGEGRVLILVDDAQWLDPGSSDVLAFVCRRLRPGGADVVIAGRGKGSSAVFGGGVVEISLGPLSRADAELVLDQRTALAGPARQAVLAQAAGNPLALLEFARIASADARALPHWAEPGPLPVAKRLERLYSAQSGGLPPESRHALVVAAAAGTWELSEALANGLADVRARHWEPAERAGLIHIGGRGTTVTGSSATATSIAFAHPLVRSAIYHTAPFHIRAEAHRQLAHALHHHADRHAWHLAKATMHPDDTIAQLLENTAAQATRRGGHNAAAMAMERAAELSTTNHDTARRLEAAATLASQSSSLPWVHAMAARAAALASDPALHAQAVLRAAWALHYLGLAAEALDLLLPLTEPGVGASRHTAGLALGSAAAASYYSGDERHRAAVRAVVKQAQQPESEPVPAQSVTEQPPGPDEEPDPALAALRLWAVASAAPFAHRSWTVAALFRLGVRLQSNEDLTALAFLGAAAWILDEPEVADRALRRHVALQHGVDPQATDGTLLNTLAWNSASAGQWDEAAARSDQVIELSTVYDQRLNLACAHLTAGVVAAARGRTEAATRHSRAASRDGGGSSRAVEARRGHLNAMIALAGGEYHVAYTHLRSTLISDGGAPLHYHQSQYVLADFALAATRTGQIDDARTVLDAASRHVDGELPRRLQLLADHAYALLADDPGRAEELFCSALGPDAARWPFEHASSQLHYGEWLRRRRRINEAKPLLLSALATFQTLGARPWVEQAATELHAAGAGPAADETPRVTRPRPDVLAGLSPRQRIIVELAGQGLTNPQIAARLNISAKTVRAHLYRAFPQLGITSRHQIPGLPGMTGEG